MVAYKARPFPLVHFTSVPPRAMLLVPLGGNITTSDAEGADGFDEYELARHGEPFWAPSLSASNPGANPAILSPEHLPRLRYTSRRLP